MALKLQYKLSGIFATGAFILVGLTTYMASADPVKMMSAAVGSIQYIIAYLSGTAGTASISVEGMDTSFSNPFKVIQWGSLGAMFGGFIGFFLRDIFAHPQGGQKKKPAVDVSPYKLPSELGQIGKLTGNESFLDDVSADLTPSASGEMSPNDVLGDDDDDDDINPSLDPL